MAFDFEKSEKLLDKIEKDYKIKNSIFKGLEILSKYTEDITITSGHEEIWAYLEKDDEYSKITEEDLLQLGKLGWMVDSDNEGFNCFT